MNNTELRNFGLTLSLVILILFGLFMPWVFNNASPLWPWIIAAILTVWSLALPSTLGLLYTVWMKIGHGLGWINTRIILGIIFYTVFFLIGIIIKIIGHDPMKRAFIENYATYRINITRDKKTNMENPY